MCVHQNIKPTQPVGSTPHECNDVGLIRSVDRLGESLAVERPYLVRAGVGGDLLPLRAGGSGDGNVRAGLGQRDGGRAPKRIRGADDERGLAAEGEFGAERHHPCSRIPAPCSSSSGTTGAKPVGASPPASPPPSKTMI